MSDDIKIQLLCLRLTQEMNRPDDNDDDDDDVSSDSYTVRHNLLLT